MNKKLKNVLVIDDDESTNFLTEIYFEDSDLNINLVFKTTAESAIEYLNSIDYIPDLIFLDINLPVMSGWDFLNQFCVISEYCTEFTKIFMCSTSTFEKDKAKAKTYPSVMDYIEKPLSVEKIKKIAETYFNI